MDILLSFAKHLNKFVRNFVLQVVHYLLTIDGHSSRNGLEWLQEFSSYGYEVILSPANTSQFCNPVTKGLTKHLTRPSATLDMSLIRLL